MASQAGASQTVNVSWSFDMDKTVQQTRTVDGLKGTYIVGGTKVILK